RKSLYAILAHQRHLHAVGNLTSLPNQSVKTNRTAMQRIDAVVVLRYQIRLSIKLETAMCDAVAIAPDNRTKISVRACNIAIQRVMPQHDIGLLAISIRCCN